MKNLLGKLVVLGAFLIAAFSAQTAEAATPILTLSNAGNSQVRIDVTGDVNSSVQLYFYNPPNSGSIQSAGVIGTTNSSGYFTTTVSNTAYGIQSGTGVFVNVNNQQSSSVSWPTITGGNVFLSQSNLSLYAGQTSSVTISGGTGTYYMSSNSNSNVASISINGSVATVTAINGGSTTFTICSASAGSSCATLYVTVNGGTFYGGQSITFSPTSVNVQVGQVQSVNVYGAGSFYLSNNSNPGVASVTISGNTLNVSGLANGSATITICSQVSNSSCGTLYVTAYSSYDSNFYPGTTYNPYNYYGGQQQPTFYYTATTYTQPVVYTQPTVVRAQDYGAPVSGVYLNQIPATGLKFNLKVLLFILGIFIWSFAIAYFIINLNRTPFSFASTGNRNMTKAEQFKHKQMFKKSKGLASY